MSDAQQPAGWYPDPLGRADHRYWDGTQWSDQVSRGGAVESDPLESESAPEEAAAAESAEAPTEALGAEVIAETAEEPAAALDAEAADATTASPAWPGTTPTADAGADRGSGSKRRWLWITVAALVGLLVGAGIGAASTSATVDDRDETIDSLRAELAATQDDLDAARDKVSDRDAQRRADEAEAAAEKAAQDRAARAEAKRQEEAAKAAAEKAAADAAAAQAAAAARATIEGDGVYAIGVDKDPGRYRTTGAPSNCYWQISSDPNGSNIIENNIGDGTAYVQVSAGQFFETTRCGSWTKVG